MSRRITVRGIIVLENKLLCCRLADYRNGKTMDFWCVPGGGLEDNESLFDGLTREMIEELGVKPVIGRLLYVQQYKEDKDNEQLEFFFAIDNPEDYLNIDLSKTTHGLEEIKQLEFIDPSKHKVLPEFLSSEPLSYDQSQPKFYAYN